MLRRVVRKAIPVPVRVALLQWPAMLALLKLERLPVDVQARPHVVTSRATPLRRERLTYDESLQRAKEQNVARAVALLDGLVLAPGALFSWHRHIGPPLRLRGFAPGPELHDERLEPGDGGGLCQVTNLLYYLAVHAGLEVVERHRHALDLFPDDSRTVPFGCGATVFFPKKDLRFLNTSGVSLQLRLTLRDGALHGALHSTTALPFRCELVERDHRFEQRDGAVFRHNRLFRKWHFDDGTSREEWLADHDARVAYPT
ncbi:MAG: VanW family protein [Archangium sp.]|nr:VanW family protein [Archangium sp.]